MAEPIPDKGRVLTAMSAFWFEQLGDVVGSHLSRPTSPTCRPRREPTRRSPAGSMLCRKAEMLPIECIVRGYLSGSAWKEYKASRHDARPGAAGGSAGVATSCPSRCSRRRPRPTIGDTTRTSPSTQAVDLVGAELGRAGPRHLASSSTAAAPAWAAERGIIIADTKFELGLVDGELVAVRRGAHARLVALLAGRRVEAGHDAAVLRQAARARLPRRPRLGQEPPPPPLPAEVVDATQRALRRGLRAHHRPVVRRLARRRTGPTRSEASPCDHGPCASRCRSRSASVPGIADPQGATIERSLPALGFDGVDGVRVGKAIRFELEAADEAAARSRGRGHVRAVPHQPGDRGQPTSRVTEAASRLMAAAGRRRPVPRLELRARRRRGGRARSAARPSSSGTATTPSAASTRWSSPAASPTATTSARAPSPASRR